MKSAAWMEKAGPEGGNAFSEFAASVDGRGVLDPKTRALILLVATSLQRCPHCVDHHLETLKKLGATNSEIAEAMMFRQRSRRRSEYGLGCGSVPQTPLSLSGSIAGSALSGSVGGPY